MMLPITSVNGCRMQLPRGGRGLSGPAACLPGLSDPPPSMSLYVGPLGPESGGPGNFGQVAGPF